MRHRIYSLIILCSILGLVFTSNGCALKQWKANGYKVGPNYCKPVAEVAPDWIDAGDVRISSDSTNGANWWLVFNDPVLNALITEAADQNLTLREAGMRVLEARAQRGVAAGNLFPQSQSVDGGYSRTLLSNDAFGAAPTGPRAFDNWDLSGNLIWEMDFWGRFRRAVESADASLDASVENYDDVLACLLAEVAATYVDIRTIQKRIEYARQNIETQLGSFEIARDQNLAGAVSEVDVRQAELNLASTQALIPQFSAALRQQNNLLCFLLGRPSEDLLPFLGDGPIPTAPASVALGIPGELLRRRPDIRRAERDVAAQSAQIGVAESDLYPHFSIAGTIGYQAERLNNTFGPSANFGIIEPSFSWDVLNYGRFRNNIAAQESAFQALAIAYQNTVLNANQEVENSITGFLNAQEETSFLAKAAKAAEDGVKLVTAQYQGGAVNFNTVFNLQLSQVTQQDAYASSQGNIALQLIGIYKALGGGWQIRCQDGNEIPVETVSVPGELPPPNDENVLPPPAADYFEAVEPAEILQLPTLED